MEQKKSIRSSKRGLTFSFDETKSFSIGQRFDYVLDTKTLTIKIVPSETGKHVFSRKRMRGGYKPLVDLRSQEVRDAISCMSKIRIQITDSEIVVCGERKSACVVRFPRAELSHLRAVAGLSDAEAASILCSGMQMSFEDLLNTSDPLDIVQTAKDLSDVYTVVSLFSGAGILDWPFFNDERFHIQYAIDYDAAACDTYRRNIGFHIVNGDVHKAFTRAGYYQDKFAQSPDVVIGGPSCKPFSNANRHLRLEDHPDSDLVIQYMRIIKTLRPKVFAMENVPSVLTACDGAYLDAIKAVANECGYNVSHQIVEDYMVGGYTTRKRAVIIGNRMGSAELPEYTKPYPVQTVRDALKKVTPAWSNFYDVSFPNANTKKCMSFVPKGGNWKSIPSDLLGNSHDRHSNSFRRLEWDKPAPTIVNWRKTCLLHPEEDRILTVAEAKALQGLPGHFVVCGNINQMQQQIGNCVPVAIGEYIKDMLLRLLKRDAPKACLA